MNAAHRETWRGRVWRVTAVRIVDERDGCSVLWHPERAVVRRPYFEGRELRIPGELDWTLVDRPSTKEALGFVRPGARHSVWLIFGGGRFENWYVNFERDSVRRGACFDLVDEKLDLIVEGDGEIRVKDEHEFVEAARTGHLDEAEVRAEMARVLADPPWPTGWEAWRPDPSWPIPQLPDGWDVV